MHINIQLDLFLSIDWISAYNFIQQKLGDGNGEPNRWTMNKTRNVSFHYYLTQPPQLKGCFPYSSLYSLLTSQGTWYLGTRAGLPEVMSQTKAIGYG